MTDEAHRRRSSADDDRPPTSAVVEDVLVEEVSIDGMCGVY